MRILVADQNPLLLAAIAATFGRHCELVTATRREACMELVEQGRFDVVVACETLADYTGLELLREIEALCPATLRIFAARPESLQQLGMRLDLFGLLGTLSYPIEPRKLLVALKVARTKLPALAATPASTAEKQAVAKGPRVRKPTTPTAAQREAFQRALARRNAARAGEVETGAQRSRGQARLRGSRESGFGAPALPSQSLKDLAHMATTKRPLPGAARGRQKVLPKRGVFVFGSGIAAVFLVGVLSFELLRTTPPVDHGRHAHAAAAQLFSPKSTLVAGTSAGPLQVFSEPSPQPDQAPVSAAAPGMPQPQTFDPDSAPPDPPPPPALEYPGPMEPPSMAHNGPPVGLQGDAGSRNGWNE